MIRPGKIQQRPWATVDMEGGVIVIEPESHKTGRKTGEKTKQKSSGGMIVRITNCRNPRRRTRTSRQSRAAIGCSKLWATAGVGVRTEGAVVVVLPEEASWQAHALVQDLLDEEPQVRELGVALL